MTTRMDPRNLAGCACCWPGPASARAFRRRRNGPKLSRVELLLEEGDDAFARLVGRVPIDFPHLVGEHRMRHPADAVGVALRGADLDDLERVAEPRLERLEPRAGRDGVLAEAQTHGAQPFLGGAALDDLKLGLRKS